MILVTGANGYLGQGIVKQLLDSGMDVTAVSRHSDHIDKRATIVTCDIFNVEEPYAYFGKPDILLHLAWEDGFSHYSDYHLRELPKHCSFIKKMAENTEIKTICVMGTMHEVGLWEGPVDENTPCNPVTPYGISKNELRKETKKICRKNGIGFQWLRGFYIVGNNPYGNSVFSKISKAALSGEKSFPFTDGQNQFDFLEYTVFCDYVVKAVSQDKVNGIINISSGVPRTIAQCVEQYIRENKYTIKLEYGAFPDRAYDSKMIWGDTTKISEIVKNTP